MLNVTILQGRTVKDPELRYTQSGTAVGRFTLAVSRSYVKQNEERQTDFINCKAFGSTAEFIAKWFKKGTAMIAEGSLQTWKSEKDGKTQYGMDVIINKAEFCESKKHSEDAQNYRCEAEERTAIQDDGMSGFMGLNFTDDDVPF